MLETISLSIWRYTSIKLTITGFRIWPSGPGRGMSSRRRYPPSTVTSEACGPPSLPHTQLTPNHNLKSAIRNFLDEVREFATET